MLAIGVSQSLDDVGHPFRLNLTSLSLVTEQCTLDEFSVAKTYPLEYVPIKATLLYSWQTKVMLKLAVSNVPT